MEVDMKEAPARISMIMQVVRVVPMTLAQNDSHESEPDHQAMARDPSTPQAAHSVAVAQPSRSVRNTSAIRSATGTRLVDSFSFSRRLMAGSAGGVLSGLSSDHTAM
jgi:hypothetical protein